jgi:hypothetical protein
VGVVAGNHDIGFHYAVSPYLDKRFRAAFRTRSVRLVRLKNVAFVLINSVAFEGDGCFLCAEAAQALVKVRISSTQTGFRFFWGGGGLELVEDLDQQLP